MIYDTDSPLVHQFRSELAKQQPDRHRRKFYDEIGRLILGDRQFSDFSQANAWLHNDLEKCFGLERCGNGHGDPVLLAFAVMNIENNCVRAHRFGVCYDIFERRRGRHVHAPAYTDFPDCDDWRPSIATFSYPHSLWVASEQLEARGSEKLSHLQP
jgi:hypothetical protein